MPLFSDKIRYAVEVMTELALAHDDLVQVDTLSRKHDVPRTYLVQIMKAMQAAGLVTSQRGPKGGYRLSKAPGKVRVIDIITALEGDVEPVEPGNDASYTRAFWHHVHGKFKESLSATLTDIIASSPHDQYTI